MKKFLLVFFLSFSTNQASAGEVLSNINGRVLINTYGDQYRLNQKLYIYNPITQRKIGIVKVMQKRRDQEAVLAQVINGKVVRGALVETVEREIASVDDLEIHPHRIRTRAYDRRSKREASGRFKIKHGIGAYLINTQLAIKTSTLDTNMSGSSLGFDYTFQVPHNINISFVGNIGYHPIKLNQFDVTYIALSGFGKYILKPNQTGLWFAGGSSYIIPTTKSSTLVNPNSISTSYSFNFALGTDIPSGTQWLSLKLEYALFPGTENTTTKTSFSQTIFGFSYYL